MNAGGTVGIIRSRAKGERRRMIEALMVAGVVAGICFLVSLKVAFDKQEKTERKLRRRIVRAYYYGKREGIDEWLSR